MTPRTRTRALAASAVVSLLLLALFLANLDLTRAIERPEDAQGLARHLARHPADWIAASALAERALDSPLPRRRELWLGGYGLAEYLAPLRPTTAEGFVRAGLFHWYELGPADRKAVLDAAAPLLQDPNVFAQLARPFWQLTRDFAYLRRVAPKTIPALEMLRDVAVAHGLFADYRQLREALRAARMRELSARRSELQTGELIALLPRPLDAADAPMVRVILEELQHRPYEPQQLAARAEELTRFAIQHGVQPLDALSPLVEDSAALRGPARARLARALGQEAMATRIELSSVADTARVAKGTWENLCSADEICDSATLRHEGPLALALSVTQTDEVPPYVEIYVDGRLTAEGEIRGAREFALQVGPGAHETQVRVVNPRTRNGIQRRIRLS